MSNKNSMLWSFLAGAAIVGLCVYLYRKEGEENIIDQLKSAADSALAGLDEVTDLLQATDEMEEAK